MAERGLPRRRSTSIHSGSARRRSPRVPQSRRAVRSHVRSSPVGAIVEIHDELVLHAGAGAEGYGRDVTSRIGTRAIMRLLLVVVVAIGPVLERRG